MLLAGGNAVVGDLCQYGWGFGMGLGTVIPPLADVPDALPSSYERVLSAGARRIFPGHGVPFPATEMTPRLARWLSAR